MSNCWPTSVTSVAGSRPSSASAAKISYSLPKPQLPMFLPAKSAGVVIPLSAKLTCRVPERWKIWAMLTMSAPASRLASALGTHARAKSTSPLASCVCGTISTPPSTMVTSRHMLLVEALVLRGEVAGELGLREPLQLEADLVDGFGTVAGRCRRCPPVPRCRPVPRSTRPVRRCRRAPRCRPWPRCRRGRRSSRSRNRRRCRMRHRPVKGRRDLPSPNGCVACSCCCSPGGEAPCCWLVGLLCVAVWRTGAGGRGDSLEPDGDEVEGETERRMRRRRTPTTRRSARRRRSR